jgi:nucleoside-diphosphate-sugar epimerase
MIEFSSAHKVKKFIYISSSSVFYNDRDQFNLTESSPIGPDFVNYYAQTKFEGEEITRSFPGTWVVLRPRAVFGPRDTVLFPRILRAAKKHSMIKIARPGASAIGDLIYIDSLCDYILRAALDPSITGDFNLTNNHPVDIQAFIANICAQLNLPSAQRSISKKQAMRIATLLEVMFRIFMQKKEPPITRFGVSVLSSSKTFDVSKCLRELGPPSVNLEEGLARFIHWQNQQWEKEPL